MDSWTKTQKDNFMNDQLWQVRRDEDRHNYTEQAVRCIG